MPGNSELTLRRIIMCKREQSMGDDGSTLALKPMGRVNWSPKQRAPVAPQKGDLSPQKFKKNYLKQKYDSSLHWSGTIRIVNSDIDQAGADLCSDLPVSMDNTTFNTLPWLDWLQMYKLKHGCIIVATHVMLCHTPLHTVPTRICFEKKK